MKNYTLYIALLILFGFSSCNSSTNKAEIEKESYTIENQDTHSDTTLLTEKKKIKSEADRCNRYWSRLDSLNQIKYNFFVDNVYETAIRNSDIPKANREFLEALKNDLNTLRNEKYTKFTLEQLLIPVFNLDTNKLGMIGIPKYDREIKSKLVEINSERDLLKQTDHFKNNGLDNLGKLVHYQSMFDSVFAGQDNSYFLYTDSRKTKTKVLGFGFYYDECLEYYHYPISKKNLEDEEKVLFASKYPLELEFESHPEIDSLIKNAYADGCYDCSFKFEPETVFATIKGVENLYFTYTDTFPLNNKFDYPERALIMRINDSTKVDLWIEDVDLFGCSCL
ncbi:hypothetical protein [Salinimicrobium gaetbulicola]|uniref:Uncharacterized protein n=1 Tax=Salinimicrobium gaetbulicola TaxID=999702 RepID=A0ABW3ICW2_9FLAO